MTSEVNIPDPAVYAGIGSFGAIVAWFVRLERRLNARLTRTEHREICEDRNVELTDQLGKIIAMQEKQQVLLEKQTENTLMHRQWMGDSIAHIRTQIAVIRDRMGDDPLKDDTGNFKRGSR